MKKIEASNMGSFNNAYHVNYHANVMGLINQYEGANLGLPETLVEKYEQDIARLQDAVNRSQAAAETDRLKKADEQRDDYYRYVRNVLVNLQYSNSEEMRELYTIAKTKILNIYTGKVVLESDNEESAHIRGFIMDVKQYFRTSITKLGIADALQALEEANDKVMEEYLTRVGNQAYYGVDLTKRLRAEVDDDYFRIKAYVELNGQHYDAVDDKTVGLRDNSQSFIDAVNQLIAKTKQSIAIGKALKDRKKGDSNANANGNANGNDNPSTGSGQADGNDNNQSGDHSTTDNTQTPDKDTSKPTNQPGNTNPGINYGGDLDEVPSEV